jgi:hypothetical protein
MIREESPFVDIDVDRIQEIVAEALRLIEEYLGEPLDRDIGQILEELNSILKYRKVSSYFFLSLSNKRIPDLSLRVDVRRRKVLCKSSFRKKVAKLNHFIKFL